MPRPAFQSSRSRRRALPAGLFAAALLLAAPAQGACGPGSGKDISDTDCVEHWSKPGQGHGRAHKDPFASETAKDGWIPGGSGVGGAPPHGPAHGKPDRRDEAAQMHDGVRGHAGRGTGSPGARGRASYRPDSLGRLSRDFGSDGRTHSGSSYGRSSYGRSGYGRGGSYGGRSTYSGRKRYGGRRSSGPSYSGGAHYGLGTRKGKARKRARGFDYGLGNRKGKRRRSADFDYNLGTRRGTARKRENTFNYGLGTKRGRARSTYRSRPYSLGRIRRSPGWDRRRSLGRGSFNPK